MLALCRSKAASQGLQPTLFQQRMEELDLHRIYRTLIVSSSSLQLLTDLEASRIAMARLREHLETGGALVMTFMTLWSPGDPLEVDWELTAEAEREDGSVVRRWTWFRYDVETQLEHVAFRYEAILDGKTVQEETQRFSPESRSYTREQAIELFEATGLEVVQVSEGFDRERVSEDPMLFTVIGVRS
mgnify:CR=1 FL=1|jgi:hypothetical protein